MPCDSLHWLCCVCAWSQIAYVMKHKQLPADEAYKFVKGKRSWASPNEGFLKQLVEFGKQLAAGKDAKGSSAGAGAGAGASEAKS